MKLFSVFWKTLPKVVLLETEAGLFYLGCANNREAQLKQIHRTAREV